MNHELPAQLRFGPTRENIWTTNDEDDEINWILAEHERKRVAWPSKLAHDRVDQRHIPAQKAQAVGTCPLE